MVTNKLFSALTYHLVRIDEKAKASSGGREKGRNNVRKKTTKNIEDLTRNIMETKKYMTKEQENEWKTRKQKQEIRVKLARNVHRKKECTKKQIKACSKK